MIDKLAASSRLSPTDYLHNGIKFFIARLYSFRLNAAVFIGYFAVSTLLFLRRLLEGDLFAHGDGLVYYYPLGAYWREVFRSGFIDWNPYNFLGYSLAGSMQPGTYYPLNCLYLWMRSGLAYDWSIVLHYALAAYFTYLLCRTQVSHLWPAVLGGASFGFAGFLMAHRGHVAMMNTGVWLPLVIYCYEKFRRSAHVSWLFGGAIVFAVQVTAGYFAVVVYTSILLLLYAALTETFNNEKSKKIRRIVAATGTACTVLALGCVLAAPQFYSTLISFRNAWRGSFDYYFFASGSYPPFEIISLVFPFLFGGGYGLPAVFPPNVVEDGGFLGCLVFITAIVAALFLRKSVTQVKVWSVVGLVVLIAMFNRYTPVGKILFWIPVYDIFRFQSRFVVGLDLALAMLFCLGLEHIIFSREQVRVHFKSFAFLSIGFICLALVISSLNAALYSQHIFDEPGIAQYLSPEGLAFVEKGLSLSSPTLYVPTLFLAFLIGIVWLMRRIHSNGLRAAILLAFLLAEQYSFSLYYDTNWPKLKQTAFGSRAFGAARNRAITFTDRVLGDSRYFDTGDMSYLTQSGVLNGDLNLPERRASLNGIEPLISADVNRMFGFFPNGMSPFADRLASGNLLLSLSAVRYLIAPSTWDRRAVLDRAVETTTSAELPPLQKVAIGAWQLSDTASDPDGEFILAPRSSLSIGLGGMMRAIVPLEKGARYLFCLEARNGETRHPLPPGNGAALTADFYGPNFAGPRTDSEQATMRLFSVDIDSSFKPFESVFETELSAPPAAELRIWNTSGNAIVVRKITLQKQTSAKLPVSESAAQSIRANGGKPYRLVFDQQGYSVYENLNALPRVFCADQTVGMDSRNATLRALLSWQVNPAHQALFDAADLARIKLEAAGGLACGALKLTRFNPGVVDIRVDSAKPSVVVFSEAWDPRWHAYLDGVEAPDYRADYFAQSVVVKPGTRLVQFRYQPFKDDYGLAGPPVFALIWLFTLRRTRKRKSSKEEMGQ